MTTHDPVFITGLSRAGKTPLRIALSAIDEIRFTRKTYLWRRYHGRFGDLGDARNLKKILSAMAKDPGLKRLDPDYPAIESEFVKGPPKYSRLFGLLHTQNALRSGKRRWGVQESGIEQFADEIFEVWPEARVVHLIRDVRQSLPARARQSASKLGWHTAKWIASTEAALGLKKENPERYCVVRYEELIEDPEKMLREICAFIGESFVPDMVEAFAGPALLQDREHARDGFVELQGPFRSFVEDQTGDRLRALGYPVPMTSAADRPYPRPAGLFGMAAWRFVGSWKERVS